MKSCLPPDIQAQAAAAERRKDEAVKRLLRKVRELPAIATEHEARLFLALSELPPADDFSQEITLLLRGPGENKSAGD
jgi:hypothetical protein